MAMRSSYFLAILLIANPFMLLFFQNCSASDNHNRKIANTENQQITGEAEAGYRVNKNLGVK